MKKIKKKKFNISKIGNNSIPFIIAEIGQAHDGSLGLAHSYIDGVYEAGGDAVKFQTHIASEESTYDESFRIKFSLQDKTRYDYWKRMEFTKAEWKGLYNHAKDLGLIFMSSPFSIKAVEMLHEIGMKVWKIGSGETESSEMLKKIISFKDFIIVSSGMSNWKEIKKNVDFLNTQSADFALLQCTSMYPTPIHSVGLNVIDEMKDKFSCPVGLSDHSGTVFPALAALAKGIDVLELHVTFDKKMFGPDTSSSLDLDEFKLICDARDNFCMMNKKPVNKNVLSKKLESTRSLFRKSISLKRSLKAGDVIKKENITFKKPASGINPNNIKKVIGKTLKNDVSHEKLLKWEDIK